MGRIDLLACSVAAGADGRALLAALTSSTGVKFVASDDATGAGAGVEGGFDYVMESDAFVGDVSAIYFHVNLIQKWQHQASVLLTPKSSSAKSQVSNSSGCRSP